MKKSIYEKGIRTTMKRRLLKASLMLTLLVTYFYTCAITSIPQNIVIIEGEKLNLKMATGLSLISKNQDTVLTASNINKQKISEAGVEKLKLSLFGDIKIKDVNVAVVPKTTVIPLGTAIGMKLYTKGVLVVGMSQIKDENNEKKKPYENSGIEQGDTILAINNNEVSNTDELIDFTFEWKGLKKLCVAVSFRSIIAEQKKEPEMTVRYYISSADLTAEKFATAIRNHWHVENKLHWRLDVVMNEDDCKIRRGNAAELFSGIRHIAINILTNDKVFKAGLRRKMRKAAMDRNYLASVLAGSGLS